MVNGNLLSKMWMVVSSVRLLQVVLSVPTSPCTPVVTVSPAPTTLISIGLNILNPSHLHDLLSKSCRCDDKKMNWIETLHTLRYFLILMTVLSIVLSSCGSPAAATPEA